MANTKTAKQLERHFKGLSNHWRIQILRLVAKTKGLGVDELATELKANMKTISEHTRKLSQAGLLDKHYQGRTVAHTLSPYGKKCVDFMNSL